MSKVRLPRQDHYEIARRAGIEKLKQRLEPDRLKRLGAALAEDGTIQIASLCWSFALRQEPFSMVLLPDRRPAGSVWQILALDYLSAEPPRPPARFVSFADLPEGRGYQRAFDGRVTARLSRGVGSNVEAFVEAAERCGGSRGSESPMSYLFRFFPRFELQVMRHEGDEDFPPSCTVLFPDNALEMLSAECVVVAAEKLVASLEGKIPCD